MECMLIGSRGRVRFLSPPPVSLTAVPKQRPGGLLRGAQRAPQQRPATQRPGARVRTASGHEIYVDGFDQM